MRQSPQVEVVGVEAFGPLALRAFDLGATEIGLEDADDVLRELVLKIEHVFDGAVVATAEDVRSCLGFDQLPGNAQTLRS